MQLTLTFSKEAAVLASQAYDQGTARLTLPAVLLKPHVQLLLKPLSRPPAPRQKYSRVVTR